MENTNQTGAGAQPVQPTVVNKLVAKICELLKIGDEGKVAAFFARQLRSLNTNLGKAQRNLESLKAQRNEAMVEYQDAIEDATIAVDDAFLAVDVERIGNNANSDEFAVEYWSRISEAEARLESITQEKNSAEEHWNNQIEDAEKVVAHLKKRIETIS
jgi:flagellar biosynthesis chaperone FliJ